MIPAIAVLAGLAVRVTADHPTSIKSHDAPWDTLSWDGSPEESKSRKFISTPKQRLAVSSERNEMENAGAMLLGAMSSLSMALGTMMMSLAKFMSTYINWIAKEVFGISSVAEYAQKTTEMNNARSSATLHAAADKVTASDSVLKGTHAKQAEEAQMFSAIWDKYAQGDFMSKAELNSLLGATDHELGEQQLTDAEWESLCKEKGADPNSGLSQHDLQSMYFDHRTHPESSIKQDYMSIFGDGGASRTQVGGSFLQQSNKGSLLVGQSEPKAISMHVSGH
eukprot:gnl/MRDRNA2_/MRDRNA2_161141_c0_seq1.p1 gnl/MRDRNA2_/MRDRNA2_161141_c0~~gnl/MRDRNA2_/MRDRNA2_161141_c0_seq1.p1  ORF type:complete len:280 (-),score=70.33 gnl/MRDRNA2_/MRDRNA2_161141_c0_seq1:102-941(-)